MKIDMSKVNLTERDIEDWLYENGHIIGLPSNHEKVYGWFGRQYALPSGIADLIAVLDSGALLVVEVKNVPINKAAILQVCRYAADLEGIGFAGMYPDFGVRKMVIGPSIDDQTFIEAQACNVFVMTFSPQVELVCNRINRTDSYQEALFEKYGKLAGLPEWKEYEKFIEARWQALQITKSQRRYSLDEVEKDDAASRPKYSVEEPKDKYDELMDAISEDEENSDGDK